MTEKFISVSDLVDYLGTLPKEVRASFFRYLNTKELCRVIEVHTKLLERENAELIEKTKNLDSHKGNERKNTLKSSMEDLD